MPTGRRHRGRRSQGRRPHRTSRRRPRRVRRRARRAFRLAGTGPPTGRRASRGPAVRGAKRTVYRPSVPAVVAATTRPSARSNTRAPEPANPPTVTETPGARQSVGFVVTVSGAATTAARGCAVFVVKASVAIVAAAAANGSSANRRRRGTGVWIHDSLSVSSSFDAAPERRGPTAPQQECDRALFGLAPRSTPAALSR